MTDVCANYKQTASAKNLAVLKNCAKCKVTQYCDRDCQKADWKMHKKICSKNAAEARGGGQGSSSSSPRLNNLDKHVPNPFTRLDQGTYLHERPEKDVFKLLIDSFRIRQEDDFNFEGKAMPRSVYSGTSSSVEPFRQYIDKATGKGGLLPPWWTAEKAKECVEFGESGAWSDLRKKVTKQDVIQHYGDGQMPMQLRMFAEVVYGVGTMGQDGSSILKMLMQVESGSSDAPLMSMMDVSR